MLDCRAFGYGDLVQAIIYLTSHDVEGEGNERLYNYLQWNHVIDCVKRIKLAFACLLTAVGIPQVLAGDEFGDQHDLLATPPGRAWREVGQDRQVPPDWIGGEPLFAWEAKVYVTGGA